MQITRRLMMSTALTAMALGAGMSVNEAAAQEDPIKFGFLLGYTGAYAGWSPALDNAARLAVEEINESGGLLGRQVELVAEDSASDVEDGVRAARKLINVDNVEVIIGPESDIIVALQDLAQDNQVPVMTTSGGTDALDDAGGTGNYIWRTNASDSFLGVAGAKVLIEELGVTEISILVENLEGTQSAASSFKRNFERFGGTVTKEIVITPGQSSYLGELRDLASDDPEVVFMAVSQVTGANIMKQAYQRGYEWETWVSQELAQQDFINAAGVEVAKGLKTWTPGQRDDDESWMRFVGMYEDAYGEPAQSGFYQAETYDAIMVTALAMAAGGEATGAAVDANLSAVANPPGEVVNTYEEGIRLLGEGQEINYEGVSGSIDFNETGNVGVPAVRLITVGDSGTWETYQIIDASDFPPS